MISSKAPDIKGNYPSAGERVGPAWQIIWDALADGGEMTVTAMADLPGVEVVRGTVSTLLYEARRAGLVRHRVTRHPTARGLRIAYYRRADLHA